MVVVECQKLITDELIEKLTEIVAEANEKDQESIELKRLRKEVKSVNDKIEKLITQIEDGIDSDRIVERLKAREDELAVLKKQLALEESKQTIMDPFYVKKFLQEMRTGDINDKRYRKMMINVFIEKIYLYDGYIRIYLNYMQGRRSGTKEVADIEKYFDSVECKAQASMSEIIPVEQRFINDPAWRTKRPVLEPLLLPRRFRSESKVMRRAS